jgi:hypothetical protein
MSNSSLPHAESWANRFDGCFPTTKAGGKKPSRFYPRNPLKSTDSDERIQGNTRKSKTDKPGFRSETVTGQENPNEGRRAERAGPPKRSLTASI